MNIKSLIAKIPVLSGLALWFYQRVLANNKYFPGSGTYWERRYKKGWRDSGSGSYNRLAEYKAGFLNSLVKEKNIGSVIEFGCGDGNQLSLAVYPKYIGLDISKTAMALCEEKFANDPSKSFHLYDPLHFDDDRNILQADLAVSLDVIYHLVEDEVFDTHMKHLFAASTKYVVIYSSNNESEQTYHERDREFTKWIGLNATDWDLVKKIENPFPYDVKDPYNTSKSDFYIYKKE